MTLINLIIKKAIEKQLDNNTKISKYKAFVNKQTAEYGLISVITQKLGLMSIFLSDSQYENIVRDVSEQIFPIYIRILKEELFEDDKIYSYFKNFYSPTNRADLRHYMYNFKDKNRTILRNLIQISFTWNETKEGFDFWRSKSITTRNNYSNILFKKI